MLVKISGICFTVKEVQYHALCRSRYQMKAEYLLGQGKQHLGQYDEETPSAWHQSRETHKKAFEIVCDFIEQSISQNNEVHLLKDLNNLYLAALGDIGGSKYKDFNISSDKLSTKIQDRYGEKIKLEKRNTKKRNVIFSAHPWIMEM